MANFEQQLPVESQHASSTVDRNAKGAEAAARDQVFHLQKAGADTRVAAPPVVAKDGTVEMPDPYANLNGRDKHQGFPGQEKPLPPEPAPSSKPVTDGGDGGQIPPDGKPEPGSRPTRRPSVDECHPPATKMPHDP